MTVAIKSVFTFLNQGARAAQEDFALVQAERGIFTVADGFGGPIPGATAARMACETVHKFLIKEAGDQDATLPFVLRRYYSLAGNVLFNGLLYANFKVLAANKEKVSKEKNTYVEKGVHERGGASVLAGYLDEDWLAVGNVGSCSVLLFREGRVSVLAAPKIYGRLHDPFETEFTDELRMPMVAMGLVEDLEPEILEYRIKPGDILLFHTDGLPAAVSGKIRKLLVCGSDIKDLSREVLELLQNRQNRDYDDNCAVIWAEFYK